MTKIKAISIHKPHSGCDYHRVVLPFLFGEQYIDMDHVNGMDKNNCNEKLNTAEVVVFNRIFPLGFERLHELKKRGVKLVCDIDDYWILNPEHPLYLDYRNGWASDMIKTIQLADLVTTTTSRLASFILPYNENVEIIPNALPFGHNQFIEGEKSNAFVYAGQSSHLNDVKLLEPVMNELKSVKGLQFNLGGYIDHPTYHKMQSIFCKADKYKRINLLPLDKYMSVYDGAGASLVPLAKNNFNANKSNLKLLEAAAKKIPAIVSQVPPYSDDEDAPAFWVKDRKDWVKHIKALHYSESLREEYGQALYEWANDNYHLAYWNKVRFDVYKSLI